MTPGLGAETADRETGADERYLADVVDALARSGYNGPGGACSTAPTPPASWSASCGASRWTCWSSARTGTAWSATCFFGQTVDKVRHGLDIPMLIARPDRAGAAAEAGASDRWAADPRAELR